MSIRTIEPNFSQMMQDYFGEGGMFPSLWQGMPSYGVQSEGEFYNPDPIDFLRQWDIEPMEPYEGGYPEDTFSVKPFKRHPSDFASDYPRHKEQAEVLDFLFAQEESRATVKSERFKLDDLIAEMQFTGPDTLRIGGVSKDLENQRDIINQGLIDLDERRQLESQMQELTFIQNMYSQRQDYEREVGEDYRKWLLTQPRIEEEVHNPTACAEAGYEWVGHSETGYCKTSGGMTPGIIIEDEPEVPEGGCPGTCVEHPLYGCSSASGDGPCMDPEANEEWQEYYGEGGPGDASQDSCFHPDSTVELEDGTVKTMREVKYGDKVKAVDKDGNIIFSEVWKDMYFNLKDNTQKKYYITIKAGGKTLKVTTMHTVFVDNLKKNMNSNKIKPGMFVNVIEGKKIVPKMVDSVNHSMEIGKYDLYTKEGTVIVDGIVTGTLAFLPHRIAQGLHKFVNKHPKIYKLAYKYLYSPIYNTFYPSKEEQNLGLQATSN